MLIKREDFLSELELVQPGLTSKDETEQSACFLFHDGRVMTYNEKVGVACSLPSSLKDFSGAVQHRPLLAELHKLKAPAITVKPSEGKLRFIAKKAKFYLTVEKLAEESPVLQMEYPKKWRKLGLDFCEAVGLVRHCATKDGALGETDSVHITEGWVEAASDAQCARYVTETGFKEPLLIKESAARHIVGTGASECGLTPGWVHFKNDRGLVLSCARFAVEEFPDLEENLAVEGAPVELPKALEVATDQAAVFCENKEGLVLVDLRPGEAVVKSEGVYGGYERPVAAEYDGKAIRFVISPQLLMRIVREHSKCQIANGLLKAESGSLTYLATLGDPDAASDGEEEQEEVGASVSEDE